MTDGAESDCSNEDDFLESSECEYNVLTVHNVLSSGKLTSLTGETKLDLDRCCTVLGNAYYNPVEFPALRLDVRAKLTGCIFTVSIFETGRIQSTGGCRPIEAKKAMMKISKRFNKCFKYNLVLENFQIQNILAVYDFCRPVQLDTFAATYPGYVDYEPERFPAVRIRLPILDTKKRLEADDDKSAEEPESAAVAHKLRKIIMGDISSAEISTSSTVGSYIVGAAAKKFPPGKEKDSKTAKQESVTANVFSTGKITFTGAKSIGSLNYALSKLKPAILGETTKLSAASLKPQVSLRIMELQQQQFFEEQKIARQQPLSSSLWINSTAHTFSTAAFLPSHDISPHAHYNQQSFKS